METLLHASIYRALKNSQAVVHTHAPIATAFGIVKKEILPLQIEMFLLMPNGVPVIPFEQPGSKALAEAVRKRIKNYGAVILENHGIVTTGTTIEAACNLNAMVEEGAKIQFLVMTLDGQGSLDLAKLKEKFKIQNSIE